jgi:hypothetical protein
LTPLTLWVETSLSYFCGTPFDRDKEMAFGIA